MRRFGPAWRSCINWSGIACRPWTARRIPLPGFSNNLFHDAAMSSPDECAICISYSGESSNIVKTAQILKENNCPIIAITSIGNNSLSDLATVTLRVTTREKSFSKIAGFSSLESISIVLNTLYACLFSLNYHDNLTYKLDIAKKIENAPIINNEIIAEKDDE